MATYDHEQVLTDYVHGKIDVEMTMGHALQHIGHLYAAQTAAGAEQRAWQRKVTTLEENVKTLQETVERLQKTQTGALWARLQTLETSLSTLQQTVAEWKTEIDSPPARGQAVPRAQSA